MFITKSFISSLFLKPTFHTCNYSNWRVHNQYIMSVAKVECYKEKNRFVTKLSKLINCNLNSKHKREPSISTNIFKMRNTIFRFKKTCVHKKRLYILTKNVLS